MHGTSKSINGTTQRVPEDLAQTLNPKPWITRKVPIPRRAKTQNPKPLTLKIASGKGMGDAENPEELAKHVLSALSERQKEKNKAAAKSGGGAPAGKGGPAVQKPPPGGKGRALADDLNKKVGRLAIDFHPFFWPRAQQHPDPQELRTTSQRSEPEIDSFSCRRWCV
jgi:hypothetical protein